MIVTCLVPNLTVASLSVIPKSFRLDLGSQVSISLINDFKLYTLRYFYNKYVLFDQM